MAFVSAFGDKESKNCTGFCKSFSVAIWHSNAAILNSNSAKLFLRPSTTSEILSSEVEKLLDQAHITANKNTIPNDPQSPFVTSGLRLGTPAVTSRGMNTEDMDKIAEAIAMLIKGGEEKVPEARAIVQALTDKYPLI